MNFLNLNIANRLRLGFGLQLVLILVLAIVGVKSLDKLHDGTNELAKRASGRVCAWPISRSTMYAAAWAGSASWLPSTDPAARDAANARLAANIAAGWTRR